MGKKRGKSRQMPDIGELRSMLTHRRDSQGWALVREWAEQAWDADRTQFLEVWLRYLRDHTTRWPARVCDAPLSWIKRAGEPGGFGPMQLVRHISLDGNDERSFAFLEALSRSEELEQLEILNAPGVMAAPRLMAALCEPGRLPSLRELALGGLSLGADGISALLTSALLTQLESLFISGLMPARDVAPCAAPSLPRLRALGLPGLVAPGGAVVWLSAAFKATALPALSALDLRGVDLCAHAEGWDASLFDRLALRSLDLSDARWLRRPHILSAFGPTLQALTMSRLHPLGAESCVDDLFMMEALRDERPHSPITRLDLSRTMIGARSMGLIRASRALPLLEALDVSYAPHFGVDAVEQLCRATHLEQLRELRLGGCILNGNAARALARWPQLERLTLLDLRATHIGYPAVEQLRASPYCRDSLKIEVDWR